MSSEVPEDATINESKNASIKSQASVKGTSTSQTEKKSVVSRLYQSTAASAAKSSKQPTTGVSNQALIKNRTPTLQRKNYGPPPMTGKPPAGGSSRPQTLTSSLKPKVFVRGPSSSSTPPSACGGGVATSSFINHEKNASPADWDESAIVPLGGCPLDPLGGGSSEVFLKGYLDVGPNKMVKSHSSEKTAKQGPVRAIPTLGMPSKSNSLRQDSDRTMSLSLETPKHPNHHFMGSDTPSSAAKSSLNEDPVDEMLQLYDDYLLSELIRRQAEMNFVDLSTRIETEVSTLWKALEALRSSVIEKADLNRKLSTLLELSRDLDSDINIFRRLVSVDSDAINSLSSTNFVELSNSMEHCRHHLQVIKAKISVDSSTVNSLASVIDQGLSVNSNITSTPANKFSVEAEALQKLENNLSTMLNVFEECRKSSESVLCLSLERASLRLSQDQMTVPQRPSQQNILNLLKTDL